MKMISFYLVMISLLCSTVLSGKSLDAHVHGVVRLDMASDKNELLVMLKSPSESFLGFEHKAKSKEQKELVEKVKVQWKKNILNYLGHKALADCWVTKANWSQKFTGKSHSSIFAESYIQCKKPIKSRLLEISFKKEYKNIKKIKFHLIREDGSVLNEVKTQDVFAVKF